jgi:hypothetical protein
VLADLDPLLSQGQAYTVKLSRAVVNQAKQAVNFAAARLKSAFANAR